MIKIRRYEETDAHELLALFYHTVRNVNIRDYSQAQVEVWAPDNLDIDIWKRKMRSISPFIAEIEGDIVGYIDLQESGLIDHFFCHYKYQSQGIGRSLMEHVFNIGKSRGITRFHSEVSITARPCYERLGFQVVKEQIVDIRGEKMRNYIMEKFS
ncbi:GNAT family N-acetyltransferase [Oceanisphaera sp. KMM 10153]|uniref:GNAT family N-acetyltransferase n=1 Tax=Oceanisphaera submarina TaxID=3390193 RepID=UPI00397526E1